MLYSNVDEVSNCQNNLIKIIEVKATHLTNSSCGFELKKITKKKI